MTKAAQVAFIVCSPLYLFQTQCTDPQSYPVGSQVAPVIQKTRQSILLPILTVIYADTLPDDSINAMQRGVAYGQAFILRNTYGTLRTDVTYVVLKRKAPPSSDNSAKQWRQQAEAIATELIAAGYEPEKYYGLFFIGIGVVPNWGSGPPGHPLTDMKFRGMGSGPYCMAEQTPTCQSMTTEPTCSARPDCIWVEQNCFYRFGGNGCAHFGLHHWPAGKPLGQPGGTVDYNTGWLFVHEMMGHGVERWLEDATGRMAYAAHPDFIFLNEARHYLDNGLYVGPPIYGFGVDAGWMGGSLRSVPYGDFLKLPCAAKQASCLINEPDSDGDGLADALEKTLGSNAALPDSDADGLSDLGEFGADIFESSDPLDADSDNDGIKDGQDTLPLDAFQPEIKKASPIIGGKISMVDGWTQVAAQPPVVYPAEEKAPTSVQWLGAWDENYLYIGITGIPTPVQELIVSIDGNGTDTNFVGGDHYKVRFKDGKIKISPANGSKAAVELADAKIGQSAADATTHSLELAIPKTMGGVVGSGWLVSPTPGMKLKPDNIVNVHIAAQIAGSTAQPSIWMHWMRSTQHLIPLKLVEDNDAESGEALAINLSSIFPSANKLNAALSTSRPAHLQVCFEHASWPAPQCELMTGADLKTQFLFQFDATLFQTDQCYRYVATATDFGQRRIAPLVGFYSPAGSALCDKADATDATLGTDASTPGQPGQPTVMTTPADTAMSPNAAAVNSSGCRMMATTRAGADKHDIGSLSDCLWGLMFVMLCLTRNRRSDY